MSDLHLITPRQATARLARGERVAFVDARAEDRAARSGCRIPGALRLEPDAALPRSSVLVVYGEDARSERPHAVAEALQARGFDARVLAGGFAGWSELRYPTELAPMRASGRPRTPPRPALRLVSAHP